MAWDGIYFRVLDSTSDKVFAYDSGGSYISGEDFNLTGANDDPRGITWDGEYFWIVDAVDDTVYLYSSTGHYVG